MTLQAVDGRVLLLSLVLAGAIILTVAIRREGKHIDAVIPEVLDAPTPADPQPKPTTTREFVCMTYQCRGCHRLTHEHVTEWTRMLLLVTEWTCPECALIAAYEKELAQ